MSNDTQSMNIDELVESRRLAREKELEEELATYKEDLQRQKLLTEKLSSIIDEEDSSIITETLNKLLPWVIKNKHLLDDSLLNELTKKSSKKDKTPKAEAFRTFLILNGKKMSEDMSDFYNSLIKKTGVDVLEEDNDLLVVRSKNYGPTISNLAKETGYEDTPSAFDDFKVASKSLDINKENVEELKSQPLSYFTETE